MTLKTFLQVSIITGICISLGHNVVWGPQGLVKISALKKELYKQTKIVIQLKREVSTIKDQIHAWNTNIFEKEKLAREDLQMGFTNELVYILPKTNQQDL